MLKESLQVIVKQREDITSLLANFLNYDPYTSNIVYGENLYRKPSSFQFNLDFRQPIWNNLDMNLHMSTYDIRIDATYETRILSVENKSNPRFSGELVYRLHYN